MKIFAAAIAVMAAVSQPVWAQETATDATETASLSISLNALDTTENGCKLTFVVDNALPVAVDSLKAEVALFDADGVIDRLTMLDFLTLPVGKKRVRQFEIPGEGCDKIGGLLLNDIKVCDAGGIDCMANLKTSSITDVSFDG